MIKFDKMVNIGLSIIIVVSLLWFFIYEYSKYSIVPEQVPMEIVKEPNKIDWAPLVPGVTSVTLFLLKYFLGERRKRKRVPTLKDHIIFDTLEDLLENDIKHRTFGSEGRTDAIKTLITIQLTIYRDSLKQFIEDNPEFESPVEFRKKLRTCIYKMVSDSEKEWQQRQLPMPLIRKYSTLYKQRIDLLLSDVLLSSMSNLEHNEVMEVFLNEARVVFKTGLQDDVVTALTLLNGELEGSTYNGKPL